MSSQLARAPTRSPGRSAARILSRARVGVVVPAYRAAATIASVIRSVPPEVTDIFVVDDACPDRTGEVAAALGDPRVRLLRHERNQGVGGAVKTAYRAALEVGCDILVKMDADDQMDPASLPDLVHPLLTGEAGYAKGNRLWSRVASRAMPRRRLAGNLFLSMATKAASGYWNVLDPTNGYTAIRADVLKRLDWAHIEDRYFFETSMLVELHLTRVPVRDVLIPARYPASEHSSLRILPAAAEFSWRLLSALSRRLALEYFLLDVRPGTVFGVLGLALVLAGASFGGDHWIEGERIGASSLPGTVMVAAVPFLLGVQLLLQALLLDITEVRHFAPLPPLR